MQRLDDAVTEVASRLFMQYDVDKNGAMEKNEAAALCRDAVTYAQLNGLPGADGTTGSSGMALVRDPSTRLLKSDAASFHVAAKDTIGGEERPTSGGNDLVGAEEVQARP